MRKISIVLIALLLGFAGYAQNTNMGISQKMLDEIRKGYKNTPEDRALRNAVANNPIDKLVINLDNEGNYDTYFSHRVKTIGISDQRASGRCWMFTGYNVLRAEMIAKYNLGEFNFSHNYLFFYDQLEKSNLFLSLIIEHRDEDMDSKNNEWLFRNVLSDGGQFTGVSDLIMKYGLVPSTIQPETHNSNNTRIIANLIKLKLKEYALELRDASPRNLERKKVEMLTQIYRMLTLAYGEPVTEFEYTLRDINGKEISTNKYTPKSFYERFVGKDLTYNYIMFMNDPTRPYHKLYEIENDRHVADGYNWRYINLPIEEIKDMAIASIKDSTMMYYSCDVGKEYNRQKGLLDLNNFDYGSLMGTEFGMDKKQRIETFTSGSAHAMTLCAVDLDKEGNPKKWLVENSWGANNGWQGHLIITDEWFDEYSFRLVVERKYVPARILDILDLNPIMLPPWDPMFAEDN